MTMHGRRLTIADQRHAEEALGRPYSPAASASAALGAADWLRRQEAFLKPTSMVADAGHGWVIELARMLRSEVGAIGSRGSMARRAGCIATRSGGQGA